MFSPDCKKGIKLNIYHLIMIICVFMTVVIFFMLINGQKERFNDFGEKEYSYLLYNDGWTQECPDGTLLELDSLPTRVETDTGKITIFKNLPDELEEGTWISVMGYMAIVKIYIGDDLRAVYSLRPGESGYGSRTSPSSHVFAKLYLGDEGKTVRIEVESESMFEGWLGEVIIGSQGGIWGYIAKKSKFLYIICSLLFP